MSEQPSAEQKVQQYMADAGLRPATARRIPAIRMVGIEYDDGNTVHRIGRAGVNERRAWENAWDAILEHGLPTSLRF